MLDHDKRQSTLGWHGIEKLIQGFQAPSGGPQPDTTDGADLVHLLFAQTILLWPSDNQNPQQVIAKFFY
jgi:hypothetical protein